MSKCVSVLEDKVVVYQRERSSVWQARIKLDDGKWHRATTKQKELDQAKERALEICYESRAKAKSKLPQVSRRFRSVAKSAIQQMEDDLKAGRGKVVYKAYIAALNKTLIPLSLPKTYPRVICSNLSVYRATNEHSTEHSGSTVIAGSDAVVPVVDKVRPQQHSQSR